MSEQSTPTRRAIATSAALLLICSIWVWDHYRLRQEMVALRESLSQNADRKPPVAAGGAIQNFFHPPSGQSEAAGTDARGPAKSRLIEIVAKELASLKPLVEYVKLNGLKSARINAGIAELNGMTAAQVAACEQAFSEATQALKELSSGKPTEWTRTESADNQQVFQRFKKQDTRELNKAITEKLKTSLRSLLNESQYSTFEEVAGQTGAGGAAEVEEVIFTVEPGGSLRETRVRKEPGASPQEDIVWSKSSWVHENWEPASYDEILKRVVSGNQ